MKANFYQSQLDELLSMVTKKQGTEGSEVKTIPAENYTCPEKHAREKTMFRRMPLLIGHRSQIKNPGDFFVHEDLGTSYLITRGSDGVARGFYNYCQHRGAKLVHQKSGESQTRFSCPYHAWTYDSDGALTGIPRKDLFPCLDPANKSLKPVGLYERFGFLWLIQDSNAYLNQEHATPLSDEEVNHMFDSFITSEDGSLSLVKDLEFLGDENNAVFFNQSRTLKANWKLPLDAFLESYHISVLHKDSVAPYFIKHIGHSEFIGPHIRSLVPRVNVEDIKTQNWETENIREYVSPTFILFPNTCFVLHPTSLSILTLYPGDKPNESTWNHLMLIPSKPSSDKVKKHYEKSIKVLDGMTYEAEDFWISEQIQEGLDAGAINEVTLGLIENLIEHFHLTVNRMSE